MIVGGSITVEQTKWRELYAAAGPALMGATVNQMTAEAWHIIERSRPRAPILTGRLRRSGWVGQPGWNRIRPRRIGKSDYQQFVTQSNVELKFGFGADDAVGRLAATARYARVQHENMTYRHPRGGGPKYLEHTVREAQSEIIGRVSPGVASMWKQACLDAVS